MKKWIITILFGALLAGGCATSMVKPKEKGQKPSTAVLRDELERIDQEFSDRHADLMAQAKALPKDKVSNHQRAEIIRFSMAVDRFHDNYVELSKRLTKLLEENRKKESQNN